VEESGEVGRLRHVFGGDRVQVGDNGLGIGVGGRSIGQSGESGIGVELEEGGLEVLAIQKVDLFGLNVDAELGAEKDIRMRRLYPLFGCF